MKHLFVKFFLILAVLMTGRTVFDCGLRVSAEEIWEDPMSFSRALILFPSEADPRARGEFMKGLEEVRVRQETEYRDYMRKWREDAPGREQRKKELLEREEEQRKNGIVLERSGQSRSPMLPEEREKEYMQPSFLYDLELFPVSIESFRYRSFHGDGESAPDPDEKKKPPLFRDRLNQYRGIVIVVASDVIASEIGRMFNSEDGSGFRNASLHNNVAMVLAGVSSYDRSLREAEDGSGIYKRYCTFTIMHPADPWANVDLALRTFPKTKKVVLLASGKVWNDEKETALRDKLGPGKILKTILLPPYVDIRNRLPGADWKEGESISSYSRRMRQEYPSLADASVEEIEAFRSAVRAEIQPDTVIVSLSSFEWGLDPVEWLPADFDACPIFADTPPARKNAVGGFCRSMKKLAAQAGDILEQLSKGSRFMTSETIPTPIMESEDLWLNEAALKRYRLKLSDFPDNAVLANTTTKKAPKIRVYQTWTRKRIFLLLAANAAVLFCLGLASLISLRAIRRRRRLSEAVYDTLPVRVLVTDREGRIIDYHMQFGEVEQKGELLWKNISTVPWLQDTGLDAAVREAFDTGKTVVREFEIDGERRIVVLSSIPSDVLGRAAVVAVSSDSPEHKKKRA